MLTGIILLFAELFFEFMNFVIKILKFIILQLSLLPDPKIVAARRNQAIKDVQKQLDANK